MAKGCISVKSLPKTSKHCCNNMEENTSAEEAEWFKAMEEERIGQKEWTSEEPVNPIIPFDKREFTLLHCAVIEGNLPLVKFILEFEEGDKNPPNASGNTPLHFAIISGNYSICKEILQHVRPEEILKNDLGKVNVLQFAKKAGRSGIVKLFERALGHHKGPKVPINPKPKKQKKTPYFVQLLNIQIEACLFNLTFYKASHSKGTK